MCDANAFMAADQGTLRVGQAYMAFSGQKHNYKMAGMRDAHNERMAILDKKHNDKISRQHAGVERERVYARNSDLHRERMANQFEIEKERIRAVGEATVLASAEGRAGQGVDRAIFDIHQQADEVQGRVDSGYDEGIRKSIYDFNAISTNLHANLTGSSTRTSIHNVSPASSGALLMNMAAAGLGAYNNYKELEAKEEMAILDSIR